MRNEIINKNKESIELKPEIQQKKTLDDNEINLVNEPVELIVQEQQQNPQLSKQEQQQYNQNEIIPVILVDENQPLLSIDENKLTEQPINKNLNIENDALTTEQINQNLLDSLVKQSGNNF